MKSNFLETIKKRRSFYAIDNKEIVDKTTLETLINEAVMYTPSAFNSQSSRIVLLFNNQHQKFWSIVLEELKKIVKPDNFKRTEDKIKSFSEGFGTVLFFEDNNTVKNLQNKYPLYASNFPIWSQQSSGMTQFAVWNILCEQGLGASLQHYNPLIDDEVKKQWNIPEEYKLIAQMPFGNIVAQPEKKEFADIKDRFVVYR